MVLFLSSGPLILVIKDVKNHEKTTFHAKIERKKDKRKNYYKHFLEHQAVSVLLML